MAYELTDAGAASEQLVREAHAWWIEAAAKGNFDLSRLNLDAPLEERIAFALELGLSIGVIYSRFSSKRQHSTADQVRTCVQHAATVGIYCPPEFICVDEGQRGYRTRRAGLERMLGILKSRYASVLLVFKASRLYRQAFKGYQLIQQEVVEEGLRAISVSQGIDTADNRAWRTLFQVHGISDDMMIEATADHVRAGLKGLFARGYTVGALPIGYRRKELPQAPQTNRGLTRTMPEVDAEVAQLIKKHFQLIRDGMPIKQGLRKWIEDGGPADPRSTTGRMTYPAYRRMLSRLAYTGRFEFGRKRNEYSTKLDYSRQIEQPESEVEVLCCEELRIIGDELFYAVQERLATLKSGPRVAKKQKQVHLWDLVTDLYWCAACHQRFYQTGAHGKGMQCKMGDQCPRKSAVNRKEALLAICAELQQRIRRDADLIACVACRSREIDAAGDDQLRTEVLMLERKVATLTSKIGDLFDLAGQGSEQDRQEVLARTRAAQADRAAAQRDLTRLQRVLTTATATLTPEAVRDILGQFSNLLQDAAAGKLGDEAIYKAASILRRLVGGRIWVHVEQRPDRKRTNVRGVFALRMLQTIQETADQPAVADDPAGMEVSVWLRKPPRLDALAERVHQLIDSEGLSYRDAASKLKEEGHHVNSGNVWCIYRRWYQMRGLSTPKRPYNNGHRRKSA